MALTKTLAANGAKGHHKFTLTVTEKSTSTSNNTSSVSFSFVISPVKKGWNWYDWGTTISYTVTINGSKYTGSIPAYDGYSTVTLKSSSLSVKHSSDGSKTINISFSVTDGAGQYYTCGKASASGRMALTTIPRASQPSCITHPNTTENVGNIGTSITIHMNRKSTSFTHCVYCKWYTKTVEIAKNVASNVAWKIPTDFLNDIPNNTSGWGAIYVKTYNGSTLIGEKSVKFTATVASDVKPTVGTITLDPVDIGGNDVLIQNKNKLTVSVSGCTAGAGSSIKSYTFAGPGISTTTTSTSVTGGSFSDTGTLTYTVTVTDNRGRTASKSASISCYAYSSPYFGSFNAYRCRSDGTADENGTYIKGNYKLGFSSVNSTNKVTVTIFYKKSTESNYLSTTLLTDSINTSGSFLLEPFDTDSTYIFYARVTDIYGGNSSSNTVTVFGSARVLNVSADGTGVAIGKQSESSHLFECRWDAQFLGAASGPSGFSTSSDRRVKKNIQDIDIDIIDNLQPIQYELAQSNDNKVHYGFIAQDVEELLSEAGLSQGTIGMIGQIQNNGQQEYVLAYTEFIPLLTKKCQELQAEINMLKEEISELKGNTT